jgi:hypothetical protein
MWKVCILSRLSRPFLFSSELTRTLLLGFFLSIAAHQAAAAYTLTESCAGNSITVTIGGVSNVSRNSESTTVFEGTTFCNIDYDADFPMPGRTVSISVQPSTSSGQLHQVGASVDGQHVYAQDFDDSAVDCDTPPVPSGAPLEPVDLSVCYSEASYPFSSDASLNTWNIVDCTVDYDRMKMASWLIVRVNARRSHCADNPELCKFT